MIIVWPNWSKKRCVFLNWTCQNWDILADFQWRIEVRFSNIHEKKKRTPIRHLKSKKVRFFLDFEKKDEIIKYFMENCLKKLVEEKVRFFELDMSKLIYFGRFSQTNWGAFFPPCPLEFFYLGRCGHSSSARLTFFSSSVKNPASSEVHLVGHTPTFG